MIVNGMDPVYFFRKHVKSTLQFFAGTPSHDVFRLNFIFSLRATSPANIDLVLTMLPLPGRKHSHEAAYQNSPQLSVHKHSHRKHNNK
jgi:hypothetical protein